MLLLILEIIGTISFAISGAVVAIKAKFDIGHKNATYPTYYNTLFNFCL